MATQQWIPLAGAGAFWIVGAGLVWYWLTRSGGPDTPPPKARQPRGLLSFTCGVCGVSSAVPRGALRPMSPTERGLLVRDYPQARAVPVALVPCPNCHAEVVFTQEQRRWQVLTTQEAADASVHRCAECATALNAGNERDCVRCGARVCARCVDNYTARRGRTEPMCPRCGRGLELPPRAKEPGKPGGG